jgi:SAM-dependent methyltransferase
MPLDVSDLRAFYASPLGGTARRLLSQRIRRRWPSAERLVVVGLGYAAPYLGSFRGEASKLGAFMPAEQGALVWPAMGSVRTVLVEEERLPLPDNSVDRLLMVHCLEAAGGHAHGLLREVWRVLSPEGRLMIVVPNRRGLWARFDKTPFGHGQPYSRGQLEWLLREMWFEPLIFEAALFLPPFEQRLLMRSARTVERLGGRLYVPFAGVQLVEARKEVAEPLVHGARTKLLRPVVIGESATVPARRTGLTETSSVCCTQRLGGDDQAGQGKLRLCEDSVDLSQRR